MNNSDIGDISLLAECNTLCVKMLSMSTTILRKKKQITAFWRVVAGTIH